MTNKPRVSDETVKRMADSKFATTAFELARDVRDARRERDKWKQSYEHEQTDAHKLREHVRELDNRCNRYRGSLDSEMHLGMSYYDKYNALREAVIDAGNKDCQDYQLWAFKDLIDKLNDNDKGVS